MPVPRLVVAGPWRTARVFLSSTFLDMQGERDVLVKAVFPMLREVRTAIHQHHGCYVT